jgi:hypothetical protein
MGTRARLAFGQICQTVAESGAKMEQIACRFPSHAGIAIGGARDHAFKETKDRTHFRHSVKSGDNMDF